MNGKGSKPRPLSVPRKEFDSNWERIFKKKKPVKKGPTHNENPVSK